MGDLGEGGEVAGEHHALQLTRCAGAKRELDVAHERPEDLLPGLGVAPGGLPEGRAGGRQRAGEEQLVAEEEAEGGAIRSGLDERGGAFSAVGEELALGERTQGEGREGDDAGIDPRLGEAGEDGLQRGLLHHRDQHLGLAVPLGKDRVVPDHLLEIEGDRPFHLGGKHLLDAPRIDEGNGEDEARHLRGGQGHRDGVVPEGRKLREAGGDALGERGTLGQRNATDVGDREAAEAALQRDHAQLVRRYVETHDPVHQSSFQYSSLPSWSS